MTDESHQWGDSGPKAAAGWYPDPWSQGHHRYWDGSAWTAGNFPNGPAGDAGEGVDSAERTSTVVAPPRFEQSAPESLPPPGWAPPTYSSWDPAPPAFSPAPAAATDELASKPSRLPTGMGFVALVVAVMLVVGALATLGGYLAFRHKSSSPPAAGAAPGGTFPPFSVPGAAPTTVPADPAAASLSSLVLKQDDVPPSVLVQTDDQGDQVSATAGTLDLCNGTYPSESLRTARLQVSAYDGVGNSLLSTEAVLYKNTAASEQAFSELKSVAASCPATPVVSPIGEATVTTHLNAPPDANWAPPPASVSRLAYDFTAADATTTTHYVTVYLRRGRALMGVYFHAPDSPQITVAGQSTIEQIAGVFATRLAQLPASVVNG
ncbi:MAG TPA: DUF2510 domain-containing protein [Acidimicrobiales bacterium]|nr:DUF2510 domain-containing protein [Acidimicrobiales bacterium]